MARSIGHPCELFDAHRSFHQEQVFDCWGFHLQSQGDRPLLESHKVFDNREFLWSWLHMIISHSIETINKWNEEEEHEEDLTSTPYESLKNAGFL